MKKNGFTLVELLSTIVVLGLLLSLVVPFIDRTIKTSKQDLYKSQINLIEGAAKLWGSDNKSFLDNLNIFPYEITLGDLQDSGYLEKDINNPLTDENFHENTIIQIDKIENFYEYEVIDEIDPLAPVVTLNGNRKQEIEIHEVYTELGANAISDSNEKLEVSIIVKKDGIVVDSIDTSVLGIYRVTYTATDGSKTSSAIRTVSIVDTTLPVLTCTGCPDNYTIEMEQNENYELPIVTATDNSGESLQVYKTGSFSPIVVGKQTVIYSATDSSGNKATLSLNFIINKLDKSALATITKKVPNENDVVTFTNGQLINLGTYGIRYQGYDPDNYVYFNCEDYSNQTSETCETWRIIGVVDGKVKIISEEIGSRAWNDQDGDGTNDSGVDINDWNNSTLKLYLNGESEGDYYANLTEATRISDFISPSTWYLKGHNTTSNVTKDEMYNLERTTGTVYESNPPYIDDTKIGLMYPSDWAYAAMETESCLSTATLNMYRSCKSSNWINQGLTNNHWLITPGSRYSNGAFYVFSSDSFITIYNSAATSEGVRPVLYLSTNVEITGTGTQNSPFKLSIIQE